MQVGLLICPFEILPPEALSWGFRFAMGEVSWRGLGGAMVVIVTAGMSAIGRQWVLALAGAGHEVAVTYSGTEEAAGALEDEAAGMGRHACGRGRDAGDEAAAWAGAVPDVLGNKAGIRTWAKLLDLRVGRWDAVIRTNLRRCFLNVLAFAGTCLAAGQGEAIANPGSGCNKRIFPWLVDHTASKGGIGQFAKVSAVALGPHGIRVNCLAPGAIAAERTAQEAGDYAATRARATPLRRVGMPEDPCGPLLFETSDSARFPKLTGPMR